VKPFRFFTISRYGKEILDETFALRLEKFSALFAIEFLPSSTPLTDIVWQWTYVSY